MASLEVIKFIAAGRAEVFAAWIDPNVMRLWFAPGPMTVAAVSCEPKVGGRFSITMHGEEESPTAIGEYREIIANQRLVFTWGWEGDPSRPTLVAVEFRDVEGGTEIRLKHERLADEAARERHLSGWVGCLDNLALRIAARA